MVIWGLFVYIRAWGDGAAVSVQDGSISFMLIGRHLSVLFYLEWVMSIKTVCEAWLWHIASYSLVNNINLFPNDGYINNIHIHCGFRHTQCSMEELAIILNVVQMKRSTSKILFFRCCFYFILLYFFFLFCSVYSARFYICLCRIFYIWRSNFDGIMEFWIVIFTTDLLLGIVFGWNLCNTNWRILSLFSVFCFFFLILFWT